MTIHAAASSTPVGGIFSWLACRVAGGGGPGATWCAPPPGLSQVHGRCAVPRIGSACALGAVGWW
jgi:hypothetical protein